LVEFLTIIVTNPPLKWPHLRLYMEDNAEPLYAGVTWMRC